MSFLTEQAKSLGILAADEELLVDEGAPDFETEAQKLALEAFEALGCRTWGRIDFMMDETGHLLLVECNTVPGMGSHSLVPKAASASGMDMPMLIEQILLDAEVSS